MKYLNRKQQSTTSKTKSNVDWIGERKKYVFVQK